MKIARPGGYESVDLGVISPERPGGYKSGSDLGVVSPAVVSALIRDLLTLIQLKRTADFICCSSQWCG